MNFSLLCPLEYLNDEYKETLENQYCRDADLYKNKMKTFTSDILCRITKLKDVVLVNVQMA